jgi:RNA polymerase sigma factor (sigma-70 family)
VGDELFPQIYESLGDLARQVGSQEPAELVNQLYIKWHGQAALPDWKSRVEFRSYARRALRNMVVDQYREQKNLRIDALFEECGVSTHVHRNPDEIVIEVRQMIAEIGDETPIYGQILILRMCVDLTDVQRAQILGVSESTGKRLWNAARTEFKKRLEKKYPLLS